MNEIYKLMAIEPVSPAIEKKVCHVLTSNGYVVESKKTIRAWKGKLETKHCVYSDGVELKKIWLGPQKWALGIFGKRFYFSAGKDYLNNLNGKINFYDNKQREIAFNNELKVAYLLIGQIKKISLSPVEILNSRIDNDKKIFVKKNSFYISQCNLSEIYSTFGFHSQPQHSRISVCPVSNVSCSKLSEFSKNLKRLISRHNFNICVTTVLLESIQKRLAEIHISEKSVEPSGCIVFLFPNRQYEIEDPVFELLMELQSLRIPFRRAYADDPFTYSVVDQFPSIVTALGGQPHIIDLEIKGRKIWSIGIDMSHNAPDRFTTLAVTLIDHHGTLTCCWSYRLPKIDETIDENALSNILLKCADVLSDYNKDIGVVILRDGRMFENENVDIYKKYIKNDICFLEYRKRGTPGLVTYDNNILKSVYSASAQVPNTDTLIMSSFKQAQNGKPSTAKVVINKKFNLLHLTPAEVSYFLATSAASPSLGIKPKHLPAAIYWADGIAGISKNDLRFAGQVNIKTGYHLK